jgi:hypothetical protein
MKAQDDYFINLFTPLYKTLEPFILQKRNQVSQCHWQPALA